MPIVAVCEKCGTRLQADEKFAGRKARCRNCGNAVQLPAAEVVEEEPVAEDSFEDLPLEEEPVEGPPVGKPRSGARKPSRKNKKKPSRRSEEEPAENSATLRSVGTTLSVIGIGSFILPYLGIQFKLVNLFGEAQSIVASLLAVAGAVLLFLSLKHNPQAGAAAAGGVLVLLAAVYGATQMWDPNAPPGGGGNFGPPPGAIAQQNAAQPAKLPAMPHAAPPPQPVERGRATETLGGAGGSPYRHVDAKGAPLLGVHYRLSEWGAQPVVQSLRGVFAGDPGPKQQEQTVTAPEGYAVGGLIVDADKYVNAVQLIFLRLAPDGSLDPDDQQTSEWIGKASGRPSRTLAGDGTKVIGVHGRQGLILDGVGLVLEAGP